MSLKEYKGKRDFRRSPEPKGKTSQTPGQQFVVQKHAASRLHYDFRLELDGVLKSWAVPKGPSLNPSTKALAVQVEDHPLDYAGFEGVIPKGEYGGGTVMVWDRGTWEPEGDAAKQLRAGKLKFQLHGEKLNGGWSLVRMAGRAGEGGKNWLLIKQRDKAARARGISAARDAESVLSGRSMDEIASDADRVWQSNRSTNGASGKTTTKNKRAADKSLQAIAAKLSGARKSPWPRKFKPQLATLASEIPSGDGWLHELKFDGYRLLAMIHDGRVRLVTRNGNDWTHRFRATEKALAGLPVTSTILDGEIVSLNDEGVSDFQQLQNVMKRGDDAALVYYLFDIPYFEGYDLTQVALSDRKALLARVMSSAGTDKNGIIRYSDHIQGKGDEVFAHACRSSLEGIISKKANSAYEQQRAATWLKIKCLKRQEFIICGYTRPSGSRVGFGALILGYYEGKKLQYAGRVGTGFTRQSLRDLKAELKRRHADSSPFSGTLKREHSRGVIWVRPELVCEIEFTEWTDDGLLRHPSFQGLREDKPPEQIRRELPKPISQLQTSAKSQNTTKAMTQNDGEATIAGVRITNPGRIVYPEQGLTKLQLAEFYESIADWILPFIQNRPLTLVRCPSGSTGKCFYQKHLTDSLPDALRGVMVQERGKKSEYVVLDDLTGLISLVQMGVLEIHPWLASAKELEKPDRIIFDLDPDPGVGWDRVVAAAREVRKRIERHNLQTFVQTSGGKGLHVVIPLKPKKSWDEVKAFAKSVAQAMAHDDPSAYIATASKAKRKGKIFIDYLRNSRGATAVSPYSTRARTGAPVATPLRWEELSKIDAANHYTVANLPRRLSALTENPWKDFFFTRQSL